ncbi:TetR/AcrR family transcriptional regulator [Microbacterium sp.]|uniref:TetR/AcrR family transcriptional regulator n=1 Tax=Microbacterium sp. TaxID=51671 RepID=UPI003F9943C9
MDARIVRTREALVQAIDQSLRGGTEKLPTITELCATAGISRPTFYQHFRDVPSLVAAAGVDELQHLFDGVSRELPDGERWEQTAPPVIRDLIQLLFAAGGYFRRVLEESDTHAFQERVVEYLAERMMAFTPLGDAARAGADRAHLARTATFLAAGATWLVVAWLKEGASPASVPAAADEVSQLLVTSIAVQTRADRAVAAAKRGMRP